MLLILNANIKTIKVFRLKSRDIKCGFTVPGLNKRILIFYLIPYLIQYFNQIKTLT